MSYFSDNRRFDPDKPELDMWLVDQALGMTEGYVLNFNDKTFDDFIKRKFGIDPRAPTYTVDGTSKAKRLRALLKALVPGAQAEVLSALWAHRENYTNNGMHSNLEPEVEAAFLAMIARLEGSDLAIDLEVVEAFTNDPSLLEIIEAIHRDIQANKPNAALDRLHTYSMKKFADLLERDGVSVDHNDALHSRAGRYINKLRQSGQIGEYSEKIAKAAVQIMEQFNSIRNKQSLAHDNTILGVAEGRYVFETVLSLLRFIKALDEQRFGR